MTPFDDEDAFLTGVNLGSSINDLKISHQKENIKICHQKVNKVIDALGTKLDMMKQKQRDDYVEAYMLHMKGVKKEMDRLRAFVEDLLSSKTKTLRLQALQVGKS